MHYIRFYLLFIFLGSGLSVEARFKSHDAATLAFENYVRNVVVAADGKASSDVKMSIKVLKEGGRDTVARFSLTYNQVTTKLIIKEAYTLHKGQKFSVDPHKIEDKSVASNVEGFDEERRATIHFPRPEVGATIYLHYVEEQLKTPIPGAFDSMYIFGESMLWKKGQLKLQSALPFSAVIQDPFKVLSIKKEAGGAKGLLKGLTVTLKKPLFIETTNELTDSALSPEKQTRVLVSTHPSWESFGMFFSRAYDKVLRAGLPKQFADIVETARHEKGVIDKINTITSLLNQIVTYAGDWRTVNGKFSPQTFEKIAQTQLGDCKDFATLTVKMLRELGYEAYPAFVFRGDLNRPDFLVHPSIYGFNHVVLKVFDKQGNAYIIDPTNDTSMAGGIYKDIAAQYMLVLNPKEISYERAPSISPQRAKVDSTWTVYTNGEFKFEATLYGEFAEMLTGLEMQASKKEILELVYDKFFQQKIPEKYRIDHYIPNLKSRVVRPIKIMVHFKDPHLFQSTNLGKLCQVDGLNFSLSNIEGVDFDHDQNDVYLGKPRTITRKIILKNMHPQKLESLAYNFTSPYMTASRAFKREGKDTIIEDEQFVPKSWLLQKDMKKPIMKKIRKFFQAHRKVGIILPS